MRWTSLVAIYFLMFVGSAFITLPFAVGKTDAEAGGELVHGQAESAPHQFSLPRHLLRAAIFAALVTVLFDLNYIYGWITADDLDFYRMIFGD
jgi:predicted secreted protein